jgi:hypothetical protein
VETDLSHAFDVLDGEQRESVEGDAHKGVIAGFDDGQQGLYNTARREHGVDLHQTAYHPHRLHALLIQCCS